MQSPPPQEVVAEDAATRLQKYVEKLSPGEAASLYVQKLYEALQLNHDTEAEDSTDDKVVLGAEETIHVSPEADDSTDEDYR